MHSNKLIVSVALPDGALEKMRPPVVGESRDFARDNVGVILQARLPSANQKRKLRLDAVKSMRLSGQALVGGPSYKLSGACPELVS